MPAVPFQHSPTSLPASVLPLDYVQQVFRAWSSALPLLRSGPPCPPRGLNTMIQEIKMKAGALEQGGGLGSFLPLSPHPKCMVGFEGAEEETVGIHVLEKLLSALY